MTDRKSRRVVIINNINSDTIDQAIFILKSDKRDAALSKTDGDIVHEAQNIINNYIHQVERIRCTTEAARAGKRKKGGFSLTAIMSVIGCIAAVLVIIGYVMR